MISLSEEFDPNFPGFTVGNSNLMTMSISFKKSHPQKSYIIDEVFKISNNLNLIIGGYEFYAGLAAEVFPDAPVDRVIDAAVFFNLIYQFDNTFGEDTFNRAYTAEKPTFEFLKKVWLEGSIHEFSPIQQVNNFLNGMLFFRRILTEKSNPEFFQKFTKNFLTHLDYSLRDNTYTTVEEYMRSRRWTGAMDACLDLYEYVYDNYLPNSLLKENEFIKRLSQLCHLHVSYINDVVSYPAEEHSDQNLIKAFMKIDGNSHKQAVLRAIEQVNSYDREFSELYQNKEEELEKVDAAYREQAAKHVESIRKSIATYYRWQMNTPRYRHPNHFLADFRA